MMSDKTCKHFRILYVLGLLLSFVSLFLEWYIYQVYDSHHSLKSYWSYNPITGWSTVFSKNSTVNNALKPHTFHIPITVTVLYFIMLVVSAYTVIFQYSIGPGYCAQIFGFIFVFPYALFYYFTVTGFRSQKDSAKNAVAQYVKAVQDPVDMDKLIANEQLKLKFGDKSFDVLEELESYYPQPIKKRAG